MLTQNSPAVECAIAQRLDECFPDAVRTRETFGGECTLEIERHRLEDVLALLRYDPALHFDFLTDLTAIDYGALEAVERFALVYHLDSHMHDHRLRLKTFLDGELSVPTAKNLWPGAAWLECEVYDMFGVEFGGHEGLARLLMPANFAHHPLRKDYPLQGMGERDEEIPEENADEGSEGAVSLNLGPHHPATGSDLHIVLEVDGEIVAAAQANPGLSHSGIEKLGEWHTYTQFITATDRISYHAPFAGNLAYVLAVEKMLELEVPRRAQYIRVALAELARIADHLVWQAQQAAGVGAEVVSAYALEQREHFCDLFEATTGARLMASFVRIGGVAEDVPEHFEQMARVCVHGARALVGEVHGMLTRNRIWVERARGVGVIQAEQVIAWGVSGPVARAAGVERDVRYSAPYGLYEEFDFDVPVGAEGDVYDRYLVRLEEVLQSCRIVDQAVGNLPDGPCGNASDKVALAPKSQVYSRVESLIHHFKFWMHGHGIRSAPGVEVYVPTEAANGEFGFYIVSDGTDRAYRMRVRTPSFANYQIFPQMVRGGDLAAAATLLASLNIAPGEVDR